MRPNSRRTATLALFGLIAAAPLMGQPGVIIRAHTTEIGGFVGGSYGIDQTRVMGGGNVVYAVTREIMPEAEVSYFPGIGRKFVTAGSTQTFSVPVTDFNFGVHVRVPIPKSRVIPYGVLSFGALHFSEQTRQIQTPDLLNPGKTVTTSVSVPSSTNYATSFGGGIRVYATERLGFRGEVKAYKPNGGLDLFYRATGGFFFQF